jgi:putative ATPase
LQRLDEETLGSLVRNAASDSERGLGLLDVTVDDEGVAALAHAADGDARRALGLLEAAVSVHRRSNPPGTTLALEAITEAAGHRILLHDRDREEHYNVTSALIKSLRASDPDAALYYAARMIEAGEDALFIARRLVVFASEDIGNADPRALGIATSVHLAIERIGMPEGRIPLAQAITFLACAPKSNASYLGIGRAAAAVRAHGSLPVPMHLRNAPTELMKDMGYGADYEYPHNVAEQFVAARNLPEELGATTFYEPKREGAEAAIADRLAEWRKRRAATGQAGKSTKD